MNHDNAQEGEGAPARDKPPHSNHAHPDRGGSRASLERHFPLNTGARFSEKAFNASILS